MIRFAPFTERPMLPEVQTAESWKYVRSVKLLPLDNGEWAIFTHRFTLYAIGPWAEIEQLCAELGVEQHAYRDYDDRERAAPRIVRGIDLSQFKL